MARRSRAAAVAGVELLERVRERLAGAGWPAGLTLLSGDDTFHLDRIQQTLLSALVPEGATDFGLTVFDQETVDVSKVVAAARSRGMFAPSRVVLVRDVDVLEGEPGPLLAYAREPPPESYLLVRAAALDQRRKLHKALWEAGERLDCRREALGAATVSRITATLAAGLGIRLSADAESYLVEVCDADLCHLANELDKLAVFVGSGGTVEIEDCRELVSGAAASTGWELGAALVRRDGAGALAAIREEFQRASEAPSSLAIGMLGRLGWNARMLLQARARVEAGESPRRAVDGVRVWRGKEEFVQGVQRYRLDELLRFPALLLEADRTLKSRSIDPRAVLETTVEKMIAGSR